MCLERFRGIESAENPENPENLKDLKKSKDICDSPKPFVLPNNANEIAIAVVSFGDRFVDESGVIPPALELAGYMLKVGGKELQMTRDNS